MEAQGAMIFILFMSAVCLSEPDYATISGYVRDAKTGASIRNVRVEIFPSSDHSSPTFSTQTDERGYYVARVTPGDYYDIYLRMGDLNPSQRTTTSAEGGSSYTVNFNIVTESNYQNTVVERYGIGLALAVAVVVLMVIVFDRLVALRGSRAPSIDELRRQRDALIETIGLARGKYHKREIDEESFREITREEQMKLLELESKIKTLER
jgi:uncharacterized membrane protein